MNIKIAIGIPTYGTIKSKTALCLMNMMNLPYEFLPIFQHGAYVSQNRQKIVDIAIEQKCTHVLFVDHDIRFNPEITRILVEQDKDIIGGMYNYRLMPLTPMVKFFGEDGLVVDKIEKVPTETFKVAGLGGGFLLIKLTVFDKIKKPYFSMLYGSDGTVVRSEDIGFCEKARKFGFDVWCDPTLDIKHIGDYEY